MKGYITNGVCYIFPQEAAQIPEVEADVIYVQEENYAAWLAANESLADKLVKYNYNLMSVQPKVWAGHTDDDLEPAQKEDPELAWSEDSATVTIGADDNIFPTLTNPHSVTVSYSSSDSEKASIDASTGEVTLVAEGDTTISAAFAGDDTYEAQTVTYTLTVNAAQPTTYSFNVYITGTAGAIYTNSYEEGAEVNYTFNTYFPNDNQQTYNASIDPEIEYTFNPGSEMYDEDTGEWTTEYATVSFTMPAADVTFTVEPISLYGVNVNDELSGSYQAAENVTITLDGPVDSISPNDIQYTFDTETMECSFTMPAEEVNIYTITPEPDPENPE